MKKTITLYIGNECLKSIRKYNRNIRIQKYYGKKFQKRTGILSKDPNHYEPHYWNLSRQYNPFKVRQRKHSYAKIISEKITSMEYSPERALKIGIPKPGGGSREITVFAITDNAISHYLFKTLRKRNQHLFSSYAYAYRHDRGPHHAIQYLYQYVSEHPRLYILDYDFSKYFDSIKHDYLRNLLDKYFLVSPREKYLIDTFLEYNYSRGYQNYRNGIIEKNSIGIPQGTSLSLFLANAACIELDREIEREGAVFARYADDVVILCPDYQSASRCAYKFLNHGKRSGTEINLKKSGGISLLTDDTKAEMRSKQQFDFLGYSISHNGITICSKAKGRIKRRISSIINKHLILYAKKYQISPKRFSKHGDDWDLVTCINEIRRYLYGRITQKDLDEALSDKTKPLRMIKCLLSYYPLVTDPQIFRELDGWLLDVLYRAHSARGKLLLGSNLNYKHISKSELLNGSWYSGEIAAIEPTLPSFFKAWRYIRKLLEKHDLSIFPSGYDISSSSSQGC